MALVSDELVVDCDDEELLGKTATVTAHERLAIVADQLVDVSKEDVLIATEKTPPVVALMMQKLGKRMGRTQLNGLTRMRICNSMPAMQRIRFALAVSTTTLIPVCSARRTASGIPPKQCCILLL